MLKKFNIFGNKCYRDFRKTIIYFNYNKFNLLTNKTILAHAIHLTPKECQLKNRNRSK